MLRTVYRSIFVVLGCICVALGVLGIFLPLLPTTPFLLLAAFCFSKGSTRLHAWLLASPYLGDIIRDWQQHGTIPVRAKVACFVLMVLFIGYPVLFVDVKWYIKATTVAIGCCSLTFVLTRPSRKREEVTWDEAPALSADSLAQPALENAVPATTSPSI